MGLGIRPPKNCVFREVTINNALQKGLCIFKMANQLQTFHEGVKGIKTPVSIKNSKSIFPSKYPISAYMVTYVPCSRLCVHALALTHAGMFFAACSPSSHSCSTLRPLQLLSVVQLLAGLCVVGLLPFSHNAVHLSTSTYPRAVTQKVSMFRPLGSTYCTDWLSG